MEQKYLIGLAVIVILVIGGIGFVFITDEDGSPDDPHTEAINTLDPDKKVNIENMYNQSQTVELEIVRNSTGETVHSEEYELDGNSSMEPAHTISVSEDSEIETFILNVTVEDQSENITVKMNKCYGNAYIEIQEDGTLYPFYSIC